MTAYAFGRAVVATDVGGMKDYVKHEETGLVVPAGSASALATSVIRLLRDLAFRKRLESSAASADQRGLNWVITAERLLKVYHSVARSD
jgi:glycosyltransferase involved in cell wall biosynthesis